MTLVPLSPERLDALAALEARAGDVRWSRDHFASELKHTFSYFRVALENEQLIGYGGFWAVAGEAQITNLVIAPEERRRGRGQALLKALLQAAAAQHCTRATLEVREKNEAAQRLYRKMNFNIVGKRPQAYENPNDAALLMERTL